MAQPAVGGRLQRVKSAHGAFVAVLAPMHGVKLAGRIKRRMDDVTILVMTIGETGVGIASKPQDYARQTKHRTLLCVRS